MCFLVKVFLMSFVVRAVIEESLLSIQRGQASNIFFFLGFNFFVLGE